MFCGFAGSKSKKQLTNFPNGNNFLPSVRYMNRNEMFAVVCELLRDSPELEGIEIAWDSNPFKLLNKDSADGISLACLLSERLGAVIAVGENPLVDDQRKCPRTVGEIVEWALARMDMNSQN
jgi:hypothetical protein